MDQAIETLLHGPLLSGSNLSQLPPEPGSRARACMQEPISSFKIPGIFEIQSIVSVVCQIDLSTTSDLGSVYYSSSNQMPQQATEYTPDS